MDAIDQLFGTKPASKAASKSSKTSTKKVDAIDALFTPSTGTGLPYVPQAQVPVVPPKPTLGSKVKQIGGEVVKGIVRPVATMIARPIQAGAALSGMSNESIDAITQRIAGDFVAPTPKTYKDVQKDIGRGIQTTLTGGLGGVAGGALKGASVARTATLGAIEGAGYGVGASLEQGNKLFSPETAKQVAIGGVVGAALPTAIAGIGKAVSRKAAPIVEQAIETVAEQPSRQLPVKNLPPIVRRGTRPSGNVPAQLFPEEKIPLEPYIPNDQLPVIEAGGKTPELPVIKAGRTPKARDIPQPVKTIKETAKTLDTETPKYKESVKQRTKILDEDPIFTSGTNEEKVIAYDNLKKTKSTDDLIDAVYGRKTGIIPDNIPKAAVFKLLREEKDLTIKQIQRLSNTQPLSEAGAGLQASQVSKTGIKNNAFDFIDEANRQIKDKIKEAKYTKNTITKFLDDIECK